MKKVRISKENLLTNQDLFSVRGGTALDCPKLRKVKCKSGATLNT